MKKAIYLKFASIAVFAIGLFFLASSKINITGAIIGSPGIQSSANFVFGIAYIAISAILFITAKHYG